MALLSGTAAQLALDFLRSGRILKEGGLETLKKAYKATNRGEDMPEEAVSEFKKILNALKTRDAAEQIFRERTMRGIPLEDRPPSILPKVPDPRNYANVINEEGFDKLLRNIQQNAEYGDTNAKYYKRFMDTRSVADDWYASSSDYPSNVDARDMQTSRRNATVSRAELQKLEALYRLFGEGFWS